MSHLLLFEHDKLLAQWKGPCDMVWCIFDVSYTNADREPGKTDPHQHVEKILHITTSCVWCQESGASGGLTTVPSAGGEEAGVMPTVT